ncbi:MAG: hypothetical protein K6L75_10720 [Cellvibrionaceae bacterium]
MSALENTHVHMFSFEKHKTAAIKVITLSLILTIASCTNTMDDKANTQPNQQPLISVKEIMTDIIEPASNTLWAAALDENIPQTDEDWKKLEQAAIQLMSATSAISLGGTGESDKNWAATQEWQAYNQQMAELSSTILKLVRERKYDDMLDAGNFLVEPCGACHTAFPGDSKF